MKYFKTICVFAGILLISACGENPKDKEYQDQLTRLKIENDSLKQELAKSAATGIQDTVIVQENTATQHPVEATKRAGKHPISLQWISWDKPGTATVTPLDGEWYSIKGSQKNKDGDYLTIDGKIKRVSEKELEFDGTIVTNVSYNNGHEPCVKKGKQTFFAKGNRKYFRLQNMENCQRGNVLDYVDIYAGSSSL